MDYLSHFRIPLQPGSKHDKSSKLVLVIGKVGYIFKSVVLQRADMDFVQSSLKKLLNGSLKQLQGWRKVERPAAARWLQQKKTRRPRLAAEAGGVR